MSTNPPTAVMMPSVSSSGFKAVLDLLERGGVRQREKCVNLVAVAAVRLGERLGRPLKLLTQLLAHGASVGRGQLALCCLLVDQGPLCAERARLTDRRQVRLRSLRTRGDEQARQQQETPHA